MCILTWTKHLVVEDGDRLASKRFILVLLTAREKDNALMGHSPNHRRAHRKSVQLRSLWSSFEFLSIVGIIYVVQLTMRARKHSCGMLSKTCDAQLKFNIHLI